MTWTDEEALAAARRSARLAALRIARGLTPLEMANACKLYRSEVPDLESGRRAISLRIVDRIATALDLPAWRVLAELDGCVSPDQ